MKKINRKNVLKNKYEVKILLRSFQRTIEQNRKMFATKRTIDLLIRMKEVAYSGSDIINNLEKQNCEKLINELKSEMMLRVIEK